MGNWPTTEKRRMVPVSNGFFSREPERRPLRAQIPKRDVQRLLGTYIEAV